MKKLNVAIVGVALALIAVPAQAYNSNSTNASIQDHYKSVIQQQPYQVEVCQDVSIGGDRTGDTLRGALLGGIIGNNNSKATGGYRTVCKEELRWQETSQTVYSHSVARFQHEGRWYSVNFQK